jgi:thioredoxin-like negative regulator of GroEL
MATLELTRENFEDTVPQNDRVIVDFWAPWRGRSRDSLAAARLRERRLQVRK